MSKVYGYCRISTNKQNIERQVRNILAKYPDAVIKKEAYTGTKIDGRAVLTKLIKTVQPGDTIVFDSVSRMSRDADVGVSIYEDLYDRGINLVFLNEPYVNTAQYTERLNHTISSNGLLTFDGATNNFLKNIVDSFNDLVKGLAREQVYLAFKQSERETENIRRTTKEGIETARRNGKQIGLTKGTKLTTKKSIKAKAIILQHNTTFGGTLTNAQTMKLAGVLSRTTYYKYKNELLLAYEICEDFDEYKRKMIEQSRKLA